MRVGGLITMCIELLLAGSTMLLDFDSPVVIDALAKAPVRLTLFGKMRASDTAGHAVLPRNRKACAVLAILALKRGKPVSRVRLTSLLWSRRDAEQARGSLRQCVHELQERLHPCAPDLLVAERAYLSLRVDGFAMDVPGADGTLASRDQMLAQLDCGAITEGPARCWRTWSGLTMPLPPGWTANGGNWPNKRSWWRRRRCLKLFQGDPSRSKQPPNGCCGSLQAMRRPIEH